MSVIIPHHQGKALILGCLRSLAVQTYSDYEVVVVDNGSVDGSMESVVQEFPQVQIIRLPRNEGFSYAINLGVKETKGEIIAFLNNDAEVDEHWVAHGVKAADYYPSTGIFACRIMDYDERDVVQNAGIRIHRCGRPSGRGRGKKLDDGLLREMEVFGASGGAMMVRRSTWEKVGPFREDFVSYLEDVDWAYRARLMGEKCWYVPEMVVYHREASTKDNEGKRGVDSPERVRLIARNKIWVLWLNTPWQLMVLHLPFIVGGLLYSLTHHLFRSGQVWAFLRGTFEGKWGIFKRWRERREIQQRRSIDLGELKRWYNYG